ncbi:hypothetical protein K8I28_17330 [bacterium]|nr:hypothetical protein [bacterium]
MTVRSYLKLSVLLGLLTVSTSFGLEPPRYGIGLHASTPLSGISGYIDLNPSLSLQAILGADLDSPDFAGRVLYDLRQEEYYHIYGYGLLAFMTKSNAAGDKDTDVGLGIGAGVEMDWRVLEPKLPPFYWSAEVGYAIDDLSIGVGIHYRF